MQSQWEDQSGWCVNIWGDIQEHSDLNELIVKLGKVRSTVSQIECFLCWFYEELEKAEVILILRKSRTL